MTATEGSSRDETDASLQVERRQTDLELTSRVARADADADEVLSIARDRADRLLAATRAAADARLPLSEQTKAAVALLVQEREHEDRDVASERLRADELLGGERLERAAQRAGLLVVERQTTDLHLAVERRSADDALFARDDFLAHVSHDLGSLMAAQKIYIAVLAEKLGESPNGEQLKVHMGALAEITAQMERMTRDLVDIVAMDGGKLAVTLGRHSATELLATAVTFFSPLARSRDQSLSVTSAQADVQVEIDATRALQVLGNLLSNAIKFTPRGGSISLGFEAGDRDVTFFVADTGPGVQSEEAEDIFKRFARARTSSSGLGLGLFIAQRLVVAHGGRLWLDRDTQRGAVFRFTFRRVS